MRALPTFKVMQIEVSNYCSLTCVYCPHPGQVRPKGNMNIETFRKCIELVKGSDNPEYQGRKFVWLNHFGEPLLHPQLPEFIAYASACGIEVSFASNGVDHNRELFPKALWQSLADAGLKGVVLSGHVRKAAVLRDHVSGIIKKIGVWTPENGNFHDWVGQVALPSFKLEKVDPPTRCCDYQTDNMFAVTWDGGIAACCYDIEGQVGLNIDDVLENGFKFSEISLCLNCRLGRGDAQWLSEHRAWLD
jgi:hypothetical protein